MLMRSNKMDHMDLFTHTANKEFQKHIKTQSKRALEVIDTLINWDSLLKPIGKTIPRYDKVRRSFSLLVIVKCFILQTIYSLSDPRLEEEIADRRSFQMFLNLTSGDSIPVETTKCRYRELFSKKKLDKRLFKAFNKQLKKAGLILEKGTIVDASVKESYTQPRKKRDEDAT